MNRYLNKYFIIIIFTFFSCNEAPEKVEIEYFDLENLVSQQIQILNKYNPVLFKKATINGVDEEENKRLDSATWASELNIFLEADINKPRLSGNYIKEVINEEDKTIITYKAKDTEKVQVSFLKIIYHIDNLIRIESLFSEKNLLYNTHRNLLMNFKEDNQGETLLIDYQISGQQKMILKDTIHYKIESRLIF